MVEKPDEHEGRVRADYNIEIKVTDSVTKKVFLCHSSNISLNGVLVVSEEKLPPQHICHINIALLEDQRHENEINLSIDGRVAREIPQGFAISFDSMDADTYFHLNNIVKYNTNDIDHFFAQASERIGFK